MPSGGSAPRASALAGLVARLRCPHCAAPLRHDGAAIACARGHRYDVARQGYVSLPAPGRRMPPGDTAEMVAARAAFLARGRFDALTDAIVAACREAAGARAAGGGCAVDVGAGTGHQLARLLDALPGWSGIALDASRPAARRAARAHPRLAAVACDAWAPLPLRDAAADLVLNAFAPRAEAELARILAPDGAAVVVTPTARHLAPLVSALGLLRVAPAKQAVTRERLSPWLAPVCSRHVEHEIALDRDDVRALVRMGPSAHHLDGAELERRLAALAPSTATTVSVVVDVLRPAAAGAGVEPGGDPGAGGGTGPGRAPDYHL